MAPLRINVICSGNICRSPIGEKVFAAALADAGLGDQVEVSSSGTGDWHVGNGADPRARQVLRDAGYPDDHSASHMNADRVGEVDLFLAADSGHVRQLLDLGADPESVVLMRSLDPSAPDDQVPDPYYGSDQDFDDVLAMIQAAAPGVVELVRERLAR